MDKKESLYSAPASNLFLEEALPEGYVEGDLTQSKLRLAGWLSIIYMLIQVPSFVISFMVGAEPENTMYDGLFKALIIVDMLLWIYLILVFKAFVNIRFGFTGVNRVIQFMIALSVVMYGLVFFMGQGDDELDVFTIVYFALLIPMGVAMVLFGKRLLSIENEFKYLRIYAWLNIISGVCVASVILFLLATPLGLIASLLIALMFFAAANELESARKSQA